MRFWEILQKEIGRKGKKLQHLVDVVASDTYLFSTVRRSVLNLLLVDLLKGWVGLLQWPLGPWGEPDSAMITKAYLCLHIALVSGESS